MFPVLDALQTAVKEAFQIDKPTPVQELAVPALLDDAKKACDVIIRARTGSGKTLGFLLPILHQLLSEQGPDAPRLARDALGTVCLIVVPTRELAVQTGQVLEKLLGRLKGSLHWLVPGVLSGGDKRKSEKARLRKTLHLVVATPGRLLDHLKSTQSWADRCRASLRWLVIDEADRLMDMGFDKTMTEVAELLGIMTKTGLLGQAKRERHVRLVLCSATMRDDTASFAGIPLTGPPTMVSPEVERKSHQQAKEGSAASAAVTAEFNAPAHLQQKFIAAPTKLRLPALLGLLHSLLQADGKVVLFVLCCDTVDYLHALLGSAAVQSLLPGLGGISPFRLHGSLAQAERLATFRAFTAARGRSLLICTDVAARGLNLEAVSAIIQYDAPCDMTDYLHRAGRTARQSEAGQSFLFLLPSEREYVELLRAKGMAIGSASWDALVQWLRTAKLPEPGRKSGSKERMREQKAADHAPVDAPIDGAGEEEEEDGLQDDSLRRKFAAWQSALQDAVAGHEALGPLARAAYLASIRAYATHASTEKHIFHVKRLHLGHLAATFGLAQPPTSLGRREMQSRQRTRDGDRKEETRDQRFGQGGNRQLGGNRQQGGNRQGQGSSNKGGRGDGKGGNRQGGRGEGKPSGPHRKRPAQVSEFGAGDIGAFFPSKKARK